MQAFWAVFQILVVIPFIAFVVFGITFFNMQTGGGFFAGVIFALLSAIGYWLLMAARGRNKMREYAASKIKNADYFAILFDGMIVIDREQEKVFAGTIKKGQLLSFKDIKTIKREESYHKGRRHHRIIISTNNFDNPYIFIASPDRHLAEQAYEKLRVALDM